MRWIKLVSFFMTVLISCGMDSEKGKVFQVEGLFYLDNLPVRVEILNGKISNIIRIKELSEKNRKIYIAPGLIDNQLNGYKGKSFGDMGEKLTLQGVQLITNAMWEVGVTTYLPTLTTSEHKTLLENFSIMAQIKDDPTLHGSIVGYHLEGPYISPVDGYRGAHPLQFVRKPDWNEFMELYEASGRKILQVTLAPEVEGGMDFISKLREKNIVVALGHHNASASQVTEAADRGAQICTHFGNGCANSINRHVNPLWPQLSDDRLMISIIGDGFHLLPEEIRVFYKVKGPGKTIITSDVTGYGGLAPGKYKTAEGEEVELAPDGALTYPAQNVLYGSASPLTKGVSNVLKVTGCSLGEAFQMASTNPARLYGLTDRGEIKPGMRADIILFTLDNFKINIRKTIVAGELMYESTK